jgi:hypothetical protein
VSGPVRHHYVPQFYLRHFANEREQIKVIDRAPPQKTYKCPVRDVASERFFYRLETEVGASLELESTLSQIEGEARGALERLISDPFPPSGEDRELIGFFVGLQWLRGRDQRDTYNNLVDQLSKLVLLNQPRHVLRGNLRSALGREPTDAEVDQLLKRFSNYKVTPHQNESIQQTLKMAPGLGRIASGRTWQLLRFAEPCLITSDSPVVTWTNPKHRSGPYSQNGFGMCDEIRFPIDMRHALILAAEAPAGEIVREGSSEQAKALNYSVAVNGYRRVFHHPDIDPLAGLKLPPPLEGRLEIDGPITRFLADDD